MASIEDDKDNIRNSLLEALKCKVCQCITRPPIYQCKNGHTLCNKCKKNLKECYLCKDEALDTRNLIAEEMAKTISYPCQNKAQGCNATFSLNKISEHENKCIFRKYECQVGRGEEEIIKCGWKGRKNDILSHVREKHPDSLHLKEEITVSGVIDNLSVGFRSCELISAYGEVFWLHRKRDANNGKYFQALQYIGENDNASGFEYTYHFSTEYRDQTITITNTPCHDTENIDAVFLSGHCLLLDYITIKFHIFDKNALSYKITIKKKTYGA